MKIKSIGATVLFAVFVLLAIAALVFVVDCIFALPAHTPSPVGHFRFAVGIVSASLSIFFAFMGIVFHGPKLVRWVNNNRITMRDIHVMLEKRSSSKKHEGGKPSTF